MHINHHRGENNKKVYLRDHLRRQVKNRFYKNKSKKWHKREFNRRFRRKGPEGDIKYKKDIMWEMF